MDKKIDRDKLLAKANSCFQGRNFSEAAHLFEVLLEKVTDISEKREIYVPLGWVYDQWALEDEARRREFQRRAGKFFSEAMKSKDRELAHRALSGKGTLLMHQGKYEEALACYEAANKQKSTPATLNDLGNIHRRLGDLEKAASYYESAIGKSGSDFPPALHNLQVVKRLIAQGKTSNN